jgi:hypothetical protein
METKQYLFQAHQVVFLLAITVIHRVPTTGSGQILLGSAGDSFTTNLAAGITNAVTYKLDFNNPISLGLNTTPVLLQLHHHYLMKNL